MKIIEAENLSKVFKLYSSPKDRLKEALHPFGKKYHREFSAVDNISLKVSQGEATGIIGLNGSGKSTLLKMICGVLKPSSGKINTNGRIAALLELGAGFNMEFTGRENVFMRGALMGLNKEEITGRFPQIEAFSEIGHFIDQPVKTYSSGMFVRLAFSTAIHVDPDILVIDEALAVGDAAFQHKCIARLEDFRKAGKTLLFVTHNVNMVKSICSHAILLNKGKLLTQGTPEDVTEEYISLTRTNHKTKQKPPTPPTTPTPSPAKSIVKEAVTPPDQDNHKAGEIVTVRVLNSSLKENFSFQYGEDLFVQITARLKKPVKHPSIAIILRDQRGYNIYGTSTGMQNHQLSFPDNHTITIYFSFPLKLREGSYSFVVSLDDYISLDLLQVIDRHSGLGAFEILKGTKDFLGVVDLQAKVSSEINKPIKQLA